MHVEGWITREVAELMVTPQPSCNCLEVSAIQFAACAVVIVSAEDRIDREYGGQDEGRTASVSNTPNAVILSAY
jgi:hypothetical protein